jgi:hypothetical protein
MKRDDAIVAARKAIADTFVVTDVGAFADEESEETLEIALKDITQGEFESHQFPDLTIVEAGVFYVTMSFDSVEGDGDFRATARVTKDTAKVVDFEAGELHV